MKLATCRDVYKFQQSDVAMKTLLDVAGTLKTEYSF